MKTRNQPCHHPVRWLLTLLGGFLFLSHLTISHDSLQGAELAAKAAAKPSVRDSSVAVAPSE